MKEKKPLDEFSHPVCVYLAGPSGSGKTYLAKELVKHYPDEFHRPLQVTTRIRRPNEKDGIDYKFIGERDYQEMLMGEELCCDTSIVVPYLYYHQGKAYYESITNYYGTPKKNLSKDKINIIIVDKGGYSTRINSPNEILFGLDYTFNEKTDSERVIGRENRDQRENFESLMHDDNVFVDGMYINSSDNYIKVDDFRRLIYAAFMKKGIYIALKFNKEEKDDRRTN